MRTPWHSICQTAFLLAALAVPSAQASEGMTNEDVVRLVSGGVPHSVILQKVLSASPNFDVTTDALVALAAKHVPPAIMQAMIERSSSGRSTPSPPHAVADERLYSVRTSYHRTAVKRTAGLLVLYRSHLAWNPDRGASRQLPWPTIKSLCYEPTPASLFARHSLRIALADGDELFFREDSTFLAGETTFKQLFEIFQGLQANVPCTFSFD